MLKTGTHFFWRLVTRSGSGTDVRPSHSDLHVNDAVVGVTVGSGLGVSVSDGSMVGLKEDEGAWVMVGEGEGLVVGSGLGRGEMTNDG